MEDEMNLSYPTLRSRLKISFVRWGTSRQDEGPIQLSPEERREILEKLDQGVIVLGRAQARFAW
jgi:hypothetical protein